jgi:uncharacterized protein DUF4337
MGTRQQQETLPMEANEAQELQEHAEHGAHESSMRPVAFTMSVLAVLVAVTTVLGHRTHTDALLFTINKTDMWNEYQAQKIRSTDTGNTADLMSVLTVADKEKAAAKLKGYADHQAKWTSDFEKDQEQAKEFDEKFEQAEVRAIRFDLSETLLEIGLVVTSVTLLTKSRIYWFLGLGFAAAGILSAFSVLLLK